VAVALVAIATLFVIATGMRPGYDAFGWLVWGKQVLHWKLNTDGAPSWKPMTFLFTVPFALAGPGQLWLWLITSVAASLAAAVFAGRIAYKLAGPAPQRRWAPRVAAALGAVGVLGISGFWHQMVIANSDPITVTLCLATIDLHLSRRPRLAFAVLVAASLSRPEAWPFAGLYALWLCWAVPRARLWAVLGVALIPAMWFSIPALTSRSWFYAGDLALSSVNKVNIIHGSKITGVIGRFWALSALPVQLAALAGLGIAVSRRDRRPLALAGVTVLWVAVEIAFALHGYSGASRYLFEPAAVMVVIAAGAAGQALAFVPAGRRPLHWIGPAAVVILVAALVPTARDRLQVARAVIAQAKHDGKEIDRLRHTIDKDGGAHRIRACGEPVTLVGFQSAVAWETGLNVGNVGYKPGREIDRGRPIVVLKPHLGGWQVRPYHLRPQTQASCQSLKIDSDFG
jgi:hypothetical protein